MTCSPRKATPTSSCRADRVRGPPWAERKKAYGLAWAWAGGIRFGFTHADLRGTFGAVDEALPQLALDARHGVVDRLYAGAGSLAGRTAFGFTVRLERVRFGQAAFALVPSPTQLPWAIPPRPSTEFRSSIPSPPPRWIWG